MRDTPGRAGCVCCLHARVTLREATFYTRTTHCHLRRGNCQQSLENERMSQNDGFEMTALEIKKIDIDLWINAPQILIDRYQSKHEENLNILSYRQL